MATATIISYPDNEINETINFSDTLISQDIVQNLWVDISETTTDTYIEISYNSVVITLNVTDECRYTPVNIAFINKDGGMQFIDFFKARTDSTNASRESFESDREQPNIGSHQFETYNVQSQSKFKVNSGFVEEELNETFKQLLLSERVWSYSEGVYTPLNVSTSNLEYKTRAKERLINYEFEFEYAFNDVNNV
jgi:hypothetical protein